MIIIGLTGSIGMGKSTVAAMMQTLGIAVHDADAEVHALLGPKGKAVPAVASAFPYYEFPQIYGRKDKDGRRSIKRSDLGKIVFSDDEKREKLESILHPFVHEAQREFIRVQKTLGRDMAALDIPLLFETGGENRVDFTINVSAPYEVQRARVLQRPGMDEDKFHAILERQMPDGEKCMRADFVIHTGLGRAHTMKELKAAIQSIRQQVRTAS